jgi:hypothetical protein
MYEEPKVTTHSPFFPPPNTFLSSQPQEQQEREAHRQLVRDASRAEAEA